MFLRLIKNLIVPKKCPSCGVFINKNEIICTKCNEDIKNQKIIEINKNIEFLDKVYASYYYYDRIRDVVLAAKYKTPIDFLEFFNREISDYIKKIIDENEIDFIIASPYHKSKLYKYEYDLPEEMANSIKKIINIPVVKAVEKINKTKKQQDLKDDERKVNLINAFLVKEDVENKNILLIDDIITTGSTVSQIALILKGAGAKKVVAYSFAIKKEEMKN